MITALFRRVFYADLARGPSLPATDNREDRRMFPEIDAIIARRAMRLNNRKPDAVRAYERTHHVLAHGPQK